MPLSPQAWAAPEGLLHGLTQLSQALLTAPAMARKVEREDALEGLRAALLQQDLELKPQKLAAYREQIEASKQARTMQAQQAAETQQLRNDQLLLAAIKAQYPNPDALTQLINPEASSGLASDPRYKEMLERRSRSPGPRQAGSSERVQRVVPDVDAEYASRIQSATAAPAQSSQQYPGLLELLQALEMEPRVQFPARNQGR